MKKICTNCNGTLSGEYIPRTVAFIGGTSVGKTSVCRCICAGIKSVVEKEFKWEYAVPKESAHEVNQMKKDLIFGIRTAATQDDGTGLVKATCVEVTKPKMLFPYRLFFCDPPGESFDSTRAQSSYAYYKFLNFVIIVIDPCSIPKLKPLLQDAFLDLDREIAPGTKSLEDNLNQWFLAMEKYHNGIHKKINCAVVINKTDIPELQEVGLRTGMRSSQCRKFLEKYGMGHYLHQLEDYFNKCRFFAVSCTGGRTAGKTYRPQEIDQLIQWLLKSL